MRRALAVCVAVAGVGLAGCGDGDEESAPSPPPVELTVTSSDRRAAAREETPQFGTQTTFRGRATRKGKPLAAARVELRDVDRNRVLARTKTGRDGRFVLRERFDRNTTVRFHVDGEPGPTVEVRRGVDLGRADVRELGDRRELTGIVDYPRDIDPELRFVLFLGSSDQPRLPRRPADPRVVEIAPGRSRVTLVFRPSDPNRWRAQLCVSPGPDSGLSGPPEGCGGRSQPNEIYGDDADQRRKEQEATADRGG